MAKKATSAATKSSKPKKKSVKRSNGAPFNEQDPKRRLGNFDGAGEHARQGGRNSGIVGQTKQKNKTDKSPRKK